MNRRTSSSRTMRPGEPLLSAGLSRRDFLVRAGRLGLGLSVGAGVLAACGDDAAGPETTASPGGGDGGSARAGELSMLVWEGYSADNVLDPFRREHSADVTAELITDDPTAINRLRAGDREVFDLINVNNPWARQVMYPESLILPLDQARFAPYFDEMLPQFAWPYQWAMSEDGEELLGVVQRFGPFNFVVNTDVVSQQAAEDEGFELFNDDRNTGRYGVLTWDNWNVMHMCMGAGIDPFAEHSDDDLAQFEETARQWLGNARLKIDDMGAMNTALVNGEIDFYCTGGTYTASPARLEGRTNIRGITPRSGPSDGKGGIVWIEITSLVNNPNLSPLAVDFLEYIQQPGVSHDVAFAEGTHNPVAQMGNAEVLAQFSEEELDALQWDSLEDDLSRCADYNVVPRYEEMVELYSQALREA